MENPTMKSLNMKLMLSAVGVALLMTPALAQNQSQKPHRQSSQQEVQSQYNDVGTYPNGASRSGSVYSRESGADDNLIR
jgi:hypothetical protein